MARRTFAKAREEIFDYFVSEGWIPHDPWKVKKVPYLTSPDGSFRLWFKPQAVWYSFVDQGWGGTHSMSMARTLSYALRDGINLGQDLDIRAMPAGDFLAYVNRRINFLSGR